MKKFIFSISVACALYSVGNAQIPTDSLQLDYSFNNNALDLSGNNFNGTVNGATISSDRFGNPTNSYKFDGSSSHILVPTASAIKPSFPFSVSLWLKIDAFPSVATQVYASDEVQGVYSGFWVGYNPAGVISAGYGDGAGEGSGHRVTRQSSTSITSGGWHNIIAIFNGLNDIEIYIDCANRSGSYSGYGVSMVDLGSNGMVGRFLGANFSTYHNGNLDDIRFYNRALAVEDITALCSEADPALSQKEFSRDISFRIYPNPAENLVNISAENLSFPIAIELYNSTGELVIQREIKVEDSSIEVSHLSPGIYIIKGIDESGSQFNTRLIIK